MTTPIDHIGIAVDQIDKHLQAYMDLLGLVDEPPIEIFEDMRIAFLQAGDATIELLEGRQPDSVIGRFVAKRGPGIHHIALRVGDIQARVDDLRRRGRRLIEPAPRPGAHGTRVAFVHPKDTGGVLVELVEVARPAASPEEPRQDDVDHRHGREDHQEKAPQ